MNRKNIYFLIGGVVAGAIAMYFAKDYVVKFFSKTLTFSEAPAKAR